MNMFKVLSLLFVFIGIRCAFHHGAFPKDGVKNSETLTTSGQKESPETMTHVHYERYTNRGKTRHDRAAGPSTVGEEGSPGTMSHVYYERYTNRGKTRHDRAAGPPTEEECQMRRGNRHTDEHVKCPKIFCQHVSYKCDLDCSGQGTGVHCELHNCTGTHRCSSDDDDNIPISAVCDGVVQCPHFADDESFCKKPCQLSCMCIGLTVKFSNNHQTSGRFTFENISIVTKNDDQLFLDYLKLSYLSYLEITDTPTEIDEFAIGLPNLKFLKVSNNSISSLTGNELSGLTVLESLDLSFNRIQFLPDNVFNGLSVHSELSLRYNQTAGLSNRAFNGVPRLRQLTLAYNRIKIIPEDIFSELSSLHLLDLSNNQIQVVPGNVFRGKSNLAFLNLAYNKIMTLPENVFIHDTPILLFLWLNDNRLSSLPLLPSSIDMLDIKNNAFTDLPTGTFTNSSTLPTLNIIGNSLAVNEYLFEGLDYLEVLLTDNPFMCCAKPKSVTDDKCFYTSSDTINCAMSKLRCRLDDAISSCFALIGSTILRVCLWVIGLSALLGNGSVIIYRLYFDRDNITKSYSIFILNLALSDLLMSIYIVMIGVVDAYYNGVYAWNDQKWRGSTFCTTAGILSTLSSEMSTFLILLVTIDRLIVIVFPRARYYEKNISAKQASIISGFLWLVSIAIAVIPILAMPAYFKGEFYSQSGVCLALPLTTVEQPGAEYSFAIFVCLNSVIFVVIVICQICIFISMRLRGGNITSSDTRKRDMNVAKTLFFVVATDFCCWFPIGVMGTKVQGYDESTSPVASLAYSI